MSSLLESIGKDISRSLSIEYTPTRWVGGYGGGGEVGTGAIIDASGTRYFVKQGGLSDYDMLNAEYEGISEIYQTKTIRVPQPICIGRSSRSAYFVFEFLDFGGSGSEVIQAEQLCAMHRVTSPNGMFGWKIDNTIGPTPQPNTYHDTWDEFWDNQRLGYMLKMAKRNGASFAKEQELREKVKAVLSSHQCVPSLVHGDLWSGNQGFLRSGEPVIYDPAVYYGDREVDIAMTKLFGSKSSKFYATYNEKWPLPPGWEIRETIYNLYHILNHYVMFGSGYLGQAQRMIDKILKA